MTKIKRKRKFFPHLSKKFAAVFLLGMIISGAQIWSENKGKEYVKVFFPDGFSVTAELAVTDEERQQGLMFRRNINPDQGMIFVFQEEDLHSFWMRNMNFPLDILWLDAEKRIVHIESGVPPCQDWPCPSYSPPVPASYVLELKAGSVRKHQLKLYEQLDFILPPGLNSH